MNFKPLKNNFSDNFAPGLELYLNNASRSPIPLTHKQIIEDYLKQWANANHDPYYFNFEHADKLKQDIGKFLSCHPNQITIGTNVAEGFSRILHGFSWKKNDEILLVQDDYPSVTLPFQSKDVPAIRWIKPTNGIATIDSMKAILSPNLKAIALSWVNYTTGQVNPIPDIARFCQNHNILLFVDATQSLGVLPIELTNVKIDCLIASLYKWCFCPQGIAISIFSEQLLQKMTATGAGVFSQHDRQLRYFPNEPSESGRKFEYGNLNILGIMLAHQTFHWFNEVGINTIYSSLKNLTQLLLHHLTEKKFEFPVDYSSDHQSSIISFVHPKAVEFMHRLHDRGGKATYRHGLVRLSPGIYQSESTIHQVYDLL